MKMEKEPGFFSALKEDLLRSLSPSMPRDRSSARRSSPFSGLRRRNSTNHDRAGLHPVKEALSPLMEGPVPNGGSIADSKNFIGGLSQWMKFQFTRSLAPSASSKVSGNSNCRHSGSSKDRSLMRLLINVMGAPLAPMHVTVMDLLPHLTITDCAFDISSGQYILQQYIAASGGQKLQNSIKNVYAMGKLKMSVLAVESGNKVVKNRSLAKASETGGFVVWLMNPDMWYVELAVGGCKVDAGCNGRLVWKHTPWLGASASKGPIRPLRRVLQGLDPRAISSIFADAKCIGDKKINGEDCFILKVGTDPQTLKEARSEGPVEMIKHVLLGYFSQKTGLLVCLYDSKLTRIQYNNRDSSYWETTINSCLSDYRSVDGIMIAHSGRSVVTLYRFGETALDHTRVKLEESWCIDEVAFNVPGLSMDCFIPPADLRSDCISEICELTHYDSEIECGFTRSSSGIDYYT